MGNLNTSCLVALQHFSESIQEYLANLDKAPDPTVRKDTFSNEIFSAYEVLFNSWLQHREAKVRLWGGEGTAGPRCAPLLSPRAVGPCLGSLAIQDSGPTN